MACVLFGATLLLSEVTLSMACTAIGVGKAASSSGYPMVGHSEDSGPMTNDVRLARVPRQQWPEGSLRPMYHWNMGYPRVVSDKFGPDYAPMDGETPSKPLGYIPQVEKTWAYWDTTYGVQNEWGLSIAESTCTARTVGWAADKPHGFNLAGIEDLSKIALERCKTARCAVETMGKISVKHGFYSADGGEPSAPAYSGSSECLLLADGSPGELWIFNVMTGKSNASAIWAAQRVPDNHVTAIGNAFTIRKMNLSDSQNFLHSPSVSSLAKENGWWTPQRDAPEIFDFFGAYGYTPPSSEVLMSNVLAFYSGRRMWRVFSVFSPSEGAKLDPNGGNLPNAKQPYPTSVPTAKGSITLQMVMDMYRDHYEGTPYDLTKGMAAGPYGNPNRAVTPEGVPGLWERAISMFRTSWSFVLEAKPNAKSVTWFGWDAPHGTAYLPFFGAAVDPAPESYRSREGHMSKFSHKTAFWAFSLVNQYQDLNFQLINADVQRRAHQVEKHAQQQVASWVAEAEQAHDVPAARKLLTLRSNAFAQTVVDEWWEFAYTLFGKYGRYVVTFNETANGEIVHGAGSQEYPEWWLRSPEVGFTTWSKDGPYHGIDLSSTLLSAKGENHISVVHACLIALCAAAVAAALAHRSGVREGKRSMETGDYFVMQA